jgi:hypothetical protein
LVAIERGRSLCTEVYDVSYTLTFFFLVENSSSFCKVTIAMAEVIYQRIILFVILAK